jgi:hypothetical protein
LPLTTVTSAMVDLGASMVPDGALHHGSTERQWGEETLITPRCPNGILCHF